MRGPLWLIKAELSKSFYNKLVELLGQHHATKTLVVTLDSSGLLTLTFSRGLFVKFTGAQLSEQARLFNRALEATKGDFKRFVFLNANGGH